MGVRFSLVVLLIFGVSASLSAQKIVYSEPQKEDTRRMVFEIAGKVDGNFLIYKNTRSNLHLIAVFDNEMQEIATVEQDYIPSNDKMINVDFFPYNKFCYIIYQYQKKNIIHCMAAKVDGKGNKIGEIKELDTAQIGFAANNKIYTVLSSEDKSKLIVFKINSKNRKLFLLTTLLFNEKLELMNKSYVQIPMDDRNENLSDFQLDNDGDLVFAKFFRNSNENIDKVQMMVKGAQDDKLFMKDISLDKIWLDEIHIKIDNYYKRFYLISYYVKERRGNIDGIYYFTWDKVNARPFIAGTVVFNDALRKEARGESSIKSAFNDFFIRNIIIRKDGGFIISGESYFTTSRFNNWNRGDYLYGYPFANSFNNYYYSPYYNSNFWGYRMGSSQAVRYHSDNLAIISFDSTGKPEWNTVIGKSQFNDESDNLLSFQIMNTGGQLHYLFNQQERRNNLLNDFSISPDGQLSRNPTLKNLDNGHEFMPKYGKQVGARQIIIPCQYRNFICFAKLDYN